MSACGVRGRPDEGGATQPVGMRAVFCFIATHCPHAAAGLPDGETRVRARDVVGRHIDLGAGVAVDLQ